MVGSYDVQKVGRSNLQPARLTDIFGKGELRIFSRGNIFNVVPPPINQQAVSVGPAYWFSRLTSTRVESVARRKNNDFGAFILHAFCKNNFSVHLKVGVCKDRSINNCCYFIYEGMVTLVYSSTVPEGNTAWNGGSDDDVETS